MEKYLTNFNTVSEYNTGKTLLPLPSVAHIDENESTHFLSNTITLKHWITTPGSTRIVENPDGYGKLIVDGIAQPSIQTTYNFSKTGEHTVQFRIDNPNANMQGAFANSQTIVSAYIPEIMTSVSDGMFYGCSSLANISLPSALTSIGGESFSQTSSLKHIKMPNSVTTILDGCFANSGLKSIILSSNITSIGGYTFLSATRLESITIPNLVTSIDSSAFYGCQNLKQIVILALTPPSLGSDVFTGTNNCPIYVPSASVNTYKNASGWSTYANRIQAIP